MCYVAAEVESKTVREDERDPASAHEVYRAHCKEPACRIGGELDWATGWHHYQPHAQNAADYHNEAKQHPLIVTA